MPKKIDPEVRAIQEETGVFEKQAFALDVVRVLQPVLRSVVVELLEVGAAGLKPSSANVYLTTLVSRGLLKADAKARTVALTPQGLEAVALWRGLWKKTRSLRVPGAQA